MTTSTSKLAPILGVNNRLPPDKLDSQDRSNPGSYVRAAVNVDITDAGTARRRKGFTLAIGGSECHSFWSDGVSTAFFVDYDTFYKTDGVTKTELAKVTPGLVFSYCWTPIGIYTSNGVQFFRISPAGVLSDATFPIPYKRPTLTVVPDGSLPLGFYQVLFSYVSIEGEESGTTIPATIEVTTKDSGISITDIPHLDGFYTAIYMTSTNDTEFYKVVEVGPGIDEYTLTLLPDQHTRPMGYMLVPMPPGNIVRMLNGRLLVASGNMLYYSEPYNYALCNIAKNYIPFPEPITLLEPSKNGFYISSDQTYWVDGELPKADLNPVLPYKAIIGTSADIGNSNSVWWMSERGIVIASQDGQAVNIQEKNVAINPAGVGASMFREEDGLKQMISVLFSPQDTIMAARSYMDAEVIRKETIL